MMPVRKREGPSSDPRVRRSVRALGHALVELLHEREFTAITVQHVLDRAEVGRATFYAHFRNKEDVLFSGFEDAFASFVAMLDRPRSPAGRLVPVAEFLAHIDEVDQALNALRNSGKFDEMMSLTMDSMARLIEQRIAPAPGVQPAVPPQLLARMLAAAFVEMLRWWTEQSDRAGPEQMDATFHALAAVALQRERYVVKARG
ncbi:MAG: helix-turn-helix domain-containing protein [Gemmatimonadaceae bacterium]